MVERGGIKVANVTEHGVTVLTAGLAEMTPLTPEVRHEIAQARLNLTMSTDDIPQINSIYHLRAKALRKERVDPTPIRMEARVPMSLVAEATVQVRLLAALPATSVALKEYMRLEGQADYGKWVRVEQEWKDWSEIARFMPIGGSVMAKVGGRWPGFSGDVRKLERWGLARWEALDWLFGTWVLGPVEEVHPALSSVMKRGVVRTLARVVGKLKLVPGRLAALSAQVRPIMERGLVGSALAKRVFCW